MNSRDSQFGGQRSSSASPIARTPSSEPHGRGSSSYRSPSAGPVRTFASPPRSLHEQPRDFFAQRSDPRSRLSQSCLPALDLRMFSLSTPSTPVSPPSHGGRQIRSATSTTSSRAIPPAHTGYAPPFLPNHAYSGQVRSAASYQPLHPSPGQQRHLGRCHSTVGSPGATLPLLSNALSSHGSANSRTKVAPSSSDHNNDGSTTMRRTRSTSMQPSQASSSSGHPDRWSFLILPPANLASSALRTGATVVDMGPSLTVIRSVGDREARALASTYRRR
jgi:hypothetical protein